MAGPQIALPLTNDLTLQGQALLEANFAWNADNNYGVGDLVHFNDRLYRALIATPDNMQSEQPDTMGSTQWSALSGAESALIVSEDANAITGTGLALNFTGAGVNVDFSNDRYNINIPGAPIAGLSATATVDPTQRSIFDSTATFTITVTVSGARGTGSSTLGTLPAGIAVVGTHPTYTATVANTGVAAVYNVPFDITDSGSSDTATATAAVRVVEDRAFSAIGTATFSRFAPNYPITITRTNLPFTYDYSVNSGTAVTSQNAASINLNLATSGLINGANSVAFTLADTRPTPDRNFASTVNTTAFSPFYLLAVTGSAAPTTLDQSRASTAALSTGTYSYLNTTGQRLYLATLDGATTLAGLSIETNGFPVSPLQLTDITAMDSFGTTATYDLFDLGTSTRPNQTIIITEI